MPPLTPGQAAVLYQTTVAEVSKTVNVSRQTLENWFRNKPDLFKAVCVYTAHLQAPADASGETCFVKSVSPTNEVR